MTEQLAELAKQAIQDLYGVEFAPVFTRSDESHGDFATNAAMQLAPKLGKAPREIAESLVAKLQEQEIVQSAQVAGPGFVNVNIEALEIAGSLRDLVKKTGIEKLGYSKLGNGKTVVCEFPSPNMAKPFSVGHMRPALQGWAVYQLMKRMGYKVITDNHLGDSGTPFGKWVVGFLRYSSDEKLAEFGIAELSRIYIEITEAMKKEAESGGYELSNEVQKWLKKLEQGDTEAVAYSERFNAISLEHMHQVMQRLEISTEYELGESNFIARGQELADALLDKKVAQMSEDAVIVSLDEYGIDTPIMLRKANGAALYATTDLATIEYREKNWHPEKVFIHTGQEQVFYFQQLKALAKKCDFQDVILHLWHGLVDQKNKDGSREKMSSRKGVILLNDLLDFAEQQAAKISDSKSDDDTKAIALAAIKFLDFTADRKNGVLFDWETMFSVHGFSGPAVQYSAVRIKSIIAKNSSRIEFMSNDYDFKAEKKLLLDLLEYPGLLRQLSETYELHKLAAYLYNLARELNRYYETAAVLKAEDHIKTNRLWTLNIVLAVLTDGLDILGIRVPEAM